MDGIELVLLCADTPSRSVYVREIESTGITPDIVSDFGELRAVLEKKSYHGILIDLVTGMRSPKNDKQFVYQVIEKYPVVQLKWDPSGQQIRTLYYGHSESQGSLKDFIENECASFRSRPVRSSERKQLHFNVLLSKKNDDNQGSIKGYVKTVSYDANEDGLFIYTTGHWVVDDTAWIIVKELKDKTPIKVLVRRCVGWGDFMHFPGIGVRFDNISDSQKKEFLTLFRTQKPV